MVQRYGGQFRVKQNGGSWVRAPKDVGLFIAEPLLFLYLLIYLFTWIFLAEFFAFNLYKVNVMLLSLGQKKGPLPKPRLYKTFRL